MFSFGYKNLYDPKPIDPGPGDYNIMGNILTKKNYEAILNKSISTNKLHTDSSFEHKMKNHQYCYCEYYPQETTLTKQSSSRKLQNYFSTSKRSDCMILPQISKGPQYYNISKQNHENSINIGSYSARKQLFETIDNIDQSYCEKYCITSKQYQKKQKQIYSLKINWAEQRFLQKNSENSLTKSRFREYSYLQKESQGPSFVDYPSEPIKGIRFQTAPRFWQKDQFQKKKNSNTQKSEDVSIQEAKMIEEKRIMKDKGLNQKKIFQQSWRLQQQLLEKHQYKRSPKYAFPQNDIRKPSQYNRQQQYVKSLSPGPGQYNI